MTNTVYFPSTAITSMVLTSLIITYPLGKKNQEESQSQNEEY